MRYVPAFILCITAAALVCPVVTAEAAGPVAAGTAPASQSDGPGASLPVVPRRGPGPAVPESPEQRRMSCPSTAYVNCMPPVPKDRQAMCRPEYVRWIKEHCSGVKVVY
jgi:hypothetical protein